MDISITLRPRRSHPSFLISLLLLTIASLSQVSGHPKPEIPVANYYDPYPIATYGAHPFHMASMEAEEAKKMGKDPKASPSTSGEFSVSSANRRIGGGAGFNPFASGEEEDEEIEDRHYNRYNTKKGRQYGRFRSPSSSSRETYRDNTPSYVPVSKPESGRYALPEKYMSSQFPFDVNSDSYSPFNGYESDSWYNTMKGGYDDYGYNVDSTRSTKNQPNYAGPNSPKVPGKQPYRPYEATLVADEEDGPSDTDPMSHYSYQTGSQSPYESYSSSDEVNPNNYVSSSATDERLLSKGYEGNPFFQKSYTNAAEDEDDDKAFLRSKYKSSQSSTNYKHGKVGTNGKRHNNGDSMVELHQFEGWEEEDEPHHHLLQGDETKERLTNAPSPKRLRTRGRISHRPHDRKQKRRNHNNSSSTNTHQVAPPQRSRSRPPHHKKHTSAFKHLLSRLHLNRKQ